MTTASGNSSSRITTVLVAFCITGETQATEKELQEALYDRLPPGDSPLGEDSGMHLDSWWVAEDERYDRSDCDSAVFVVPGRQHDARRLLQSQGFAH